MVTNKDILIISIHTIMIFTGLLMITLQMIYGIVPFKHIYAEYTMGSRQFIYRLYAIGWLALVGVGVSLRELTSGQNRQRFFGTLAIALIISIGVPIIFGGIFVVNDIASGTSIARGNIAIGLDTMGSDVIEWYYITKILFMAAPMGVIIVGVIMIFRSDGVDGYITALLEVFAAIGIFVFANISLGWAGINLFDFNPQTAPQAPQTPQAVSLIFRPLLTSLIQYTKYPVCLV